MQENQLEQPISFPISIKPSMAYFSHPQPLDVVDLHKRGSESVQDEIDIYKERIHEVDRRIEQARKMHETTSRQVETHKHILAQEVVNLRTEIDALVSRAKCSSSERLSLDEDDMDVMESTLLLINDSQLEINKLNAQKSQMIANFVAQKAMLQKELKSLREQLDDYRSKESQLNLAFQGTDVHNSEINDNHGDDGSKKPEDASMLLERKRENEAEFTRSLMTLCKQLKEADVKEGGGSNIKALKQELSVRDMLVLINTEIDKVTKDSTKITTTDDLQLFSLEVLRDNAKLQRTLNEHAEGLLRPVFVKLQQQQQQPTASTKTAAAAAKRICQLPFFG